MATADRIYEAACECRDLEESLQRVLRDLADKRELFEAFARAAGELLEAIDDERLSSGRVLSPAVEKRALELKHLIS